VNRKASLNFGSVYKKIIALMETKVKYFHIKYSDDLPLEEYRTSHGSQKYQERALSASLTQYQNSSSKYRYKNKKSPKSGELVGWYYIWSNRDS
jgi:hypothetical protein